MSAKRLYYTCDKEYVKYSRERKQKNENFSKHHLEIKEKR